MYQMAMIILDGKNPKIPEDGEEEVKDIKIINSFYIL